MGMKKNHFHTWINILKPLHVTSLGQSPLEYHVEQPHWLNDCDSDSYRI